MLESAHRRSVGDMMFESDALVIEPTPEFFLTDPLVDDQESVIPFELLGSAD